MIGLAQPEQFALERQYVCSPGLVAVHQGDSCQRVVKGPGARNQPSLEYACLVICRI